MFALLSRLTPLALAAAFSQEPGKEPTEQEPPAGAEPAAEVAAEEEAPVQPGQLLYEGALRDVVDFEDFHETPGYRRLLEILSRYTDEELQRDAVGRLDFGSALGTPDLWRGKIVRLRGIVAAIEAVRLERPIGEHVDVFRAFVGETDGSEGVVVDFLGAPPAGIELRRDIVDVEGVFYRIVRYESRRGTHTNAPYLIARGMRRLDQEALPRSTSTSTTFLVLLGAGVAYLVLRIALSMRSKKSRSEQDRARVSELIRRRAAQAAAAPPAAPPPRQPEP